MVILHYKIVDIRSFYSSDIRIIQKKGVFNMLKFLSKMAEKYAKVTNTACLTLFLLHQPKMPASMIKKD